MVRCHFFSENFMLCMHLPTPNFSHNHSLYFPLPPHANLSFLSPFPIESNLCCSIGLGSRASLSWHVINLHLISRMKINSSPSSYQMPAAPQLLVGFSPDLNWCGAHAFHHNNYEFIYTTALLCLEKSVSLMLFTVSCSCNLLTLSSEKISEPRGGSITYLSYYKNPISNDK